MSTTNQPGAGPNWPADAANPTAGDDHGGGGGVSAEALRLRHEPDVYAVKPILSIPFAVVVTFLVAFTVAAVVFAYVMAQGAKPAPFTHPQAAARAKMPLNDRLSRLDRNGANDSKPEVDAPRLETLKRLGGSTTERGFQFTTGLELPRGNSPWIHPEDILPERVAGLQRAEYLDKDKKTARIPIADAMKLVVEKGLPAQKAAQRPQGSTERATGANAGRGGLPAPAKADEPAPAPMPKAPEPPKK